MHASLSRILYTAAALVALACPAAFAHDPAHDMAQAAQRFVAVLDDTQRAAAVMPFDSDLRTFWHFVPEKFIKPDGKRPGLKLNQMTDQQRLLAHNLLASGLSHHGERKAITIMTLEAVLRELENDNPIRDAGLYTVSIFGEPSTKKTWGWRFEGHHLSLSFTLVEGKKFSVTPSFFGANPGEVREVPLKGLRALAEEEDVARALVKSLTPEQREKAVIADKAPRDIITGEDRKAQRGAFTPNRGIAFEELSADQQKRLLELVNVYATRYRPEIIADIEKREPITDGKGMKFAWMGGTEPGEGHYYRVQTEAFLFEYDNTQNNANHPHAVWRHFDGDFGEDLLRKHYETSEHHRKDKPAPAPD